MFSVLVLLVSFTTISLSWNLIAHCVVVHVLLSLLFVYGWAPIPCYIYLFYF